MEHPKVTRLTLDLDPMVLQKAIQIAEASGTDLSGLFEALLRSASQEEPKQNPQQPAIERRQISE